MDKVLQVAASGMQAQKLYIDVIANNLANVNTTGYKKSSLEFQDLLYQTLHQAGEPTSAEQRRPSSLQIGNGARVVATTKSFAQGPIVETGNPLDLAIDGEGFFMVRLPDGRNAYTRDGSFKISADGSLVTSDGYILEPEITLPPDTRQVIVRPDGQVEVLVHGESEAFPVGQLEMARFINPAGLNALGHNLFEETSASGAPFVGIPGQDGMGLLQQGFLESSNVDVVEEMVNMIEAQRAYEINSKVIRTADEMYDVENRLT